MNDEMFHPDDYQYVTRSTAARPRASSEGVFRFTEVDDLQGTLDEWSSQQSRAEFNPIPTLTVLAEMMESASDNFLKMDPDPLDDRHPVRTHPHAPYGNLLKTLFKRDDFMNKLVISYLSSRDNVEVCIAAARLLLACVPGLDSEVVFSEPEDFVPRLFDWAKNSENETLQAYSMGLLSSALEVQDNASKYRNLNAQLISIALRRLNELKDRMVVERQSENNTPITANTPEPNSPGPFSGIDLNHETTSQSPDSLTKDDETIIYKDMEGSNEPIIGLGGSTQPMRIRPKSQSNSPSSPPTKKMKLIPSFGSLHDLESSNSCWSRLQPYVIGKNKVFPLTLEMHQRLILQFLGPTGEYQDLLSLALEGKSMDLILYYINLENTRDVRFTFDALRYLTSLLVHRKFALEFVALGGVQLLLKVPRLCMASVGVITCLYYLSYNEEVMEKVCQLDGAVLDDLVNYALWCIEHSYESGMASAAMFFTHAFFYKAILHRFDQRDGLRKLYNYISTLGILLDPQITDGLSDEMLHTSVQSVRNASASFRSYIEAHMYVKLEHLKKVCKGLPQLLKMTTDTLPQYKMMDLKEEPYDLAVEVLTAMLKVSPSGWKVVEAARELGLVKTMLSILENMMDWNAGSGRNEMIRNTLEVLFLCTAVPKVREDLCEISGNSKLIGYKILLNIAEGDWYEEEAVQTHALKIILNCVQNNHINKGSLRLDVKKSKLVSTELNETDKKVWACLRNHNIIMILNHIVRQTTPALEADRLRDLSCRCMFGLSRCEAIRQIFSLLPLIANNELQGFMKIPVAQDKKPEHTRFCQSAKELIEAVTQRPINDRIPDPRDLTQERLWKSYVVSNTHITYNEKELLQLIHGHLVKKGLGKTAAELIKEADLPDVPASRLMTPAKLQPLPSVSFSSSEEVTVPTSSASLYSNVNTPRRPVRTKTPINRRLVLKTPGTAKTIFSHGATKKIQPFKGLDGIVTDYFRQQHTNCANPVTTCPPFSLFFPHQCPEPRSYDSVSYNIVKRFNERSFRRPHDLRTSVFQDEKYAFSRFRPAKSFPEQDEMYVSCAFSVDDEHLIVGMFNGDVFWINVETGNEDSHTVCHSSGVTAIEPSSDGSMLLTSSSFIRPLSALWRLRETQEHCYDFADERRLKFSNLNHDKIVGTSDTFGRTTVYDAETGRLICLYQCEKEIALKYRQNVASFSPDDLLILNDGIVWDVREAAKPIHVLDKMNLTNGGVFHPHGNEIIVNSEVWDLRTFRLLHTIPALDMCDVKFNSTGNIIYATTYLEDDGHNTFAASFRTFDSKDYSVITTVDTKRNILAIACSHGDHQLAVIERKTERDFLDTESSTIRLFDVGKKRMAEDDEAEDEEDNDDGDNRGNEHDDDDDDSSDSVSSDSLDGEDIGVFGALHNFERGSTSESSMTDEEDEDDEDHGYSDFDDDDSEGWETASGEHYHENENDPPNVDLPESDEEDPHDDSFEPREEMEHPSTSTVALNPQIRRQKRRHNDTGGNN